MQAEFVCFVYMQQQMRNLLNSRMFSQNNLKTDPTAYVEPESFVRGGPTLQLRL